MRTFHLSVILLSLLPGFLCNAIIMCAKPVANTNSIIFCGITAGGFDYMPGNDAGNAIVTYSDVVSTTTTSWNKNSVSVLTYSKSSLLPASRPLVFNYFPPCGMLIAACGSLVTGTVWTTFYTVFTPSTCPVTTSGTVTETLTGPAQTITLTSSGKCPITVTSSVTYASGSNGITTYYVTGPTEGTETFVSCPSSNMFFFDS